jgi:hypothetical protein
VNDPSFMSMLHGECELGRNMSSPFARHWMRSELLGKAATLGVLKNEEGIPEVDSDFMDLHNIRMGQRSNSLCLDAEPRKFEYIRSPSAQNHLHGNQVVVFEILSLVDDAHPTPTQLVEDLVAWNIGDGHFHRPAPAKARFGDLR